MVGASRPSRSLLTLMYPAMGLVFGVMSSSRRLGGQLTIREVDRERAADAALAHDLDAAIVGGDEALDDEQPQPEPFDRAGRCGPHLAKALKDRVELLSRYPAA